MSRKSHLMSDCQSITSKSFKMKISCLILALTLSNQISAKPVANAVRDDKVITTMVPNAGYIGAEQVTAPAVASLVAASSSDDEVSKSGVDVNFANKIIAVHNEKRAKHQSPNLSWDTTMYNFARDYAQKYDCTSEGFRHSGGPYGENLWMSGGVKISPAEMADAAANSWYSEVHGYDWNTQSDYNHFTAMIWKSTTKFGCAFKDCSGANTGWDNYVICSYGEQVPNMVGSAKENVLMEFAYADSLSD